MTVTAETPAVAPQIQLLTYQVHACREFFERGTSVLTDEHGDFAPAEGMMTVTQQVAHIADTLDWFSDALDGMQGFDLNFEANAARVQAVPSLAEARAWFVRAHDRLLAFVGESTPESLAVCLPASDPIMPGAPRAALIAGAIEHTAHHRGSLSVYARMAGLVPLMPYGEMPD